MEDFYDVYDVYGYVTTTSSYEEARKIASEIYSSGSSASITKVDNISKVTKDGNSIKNKTG
jgi:hypothetical protein